MLRAAGTCPLSSGGQGYQPLPDHTGIGGVQVDELR